MKYIKTFESYNRDDIAEKLIEQLDSGIIEEYYFDHCYTEPSDSELMNLVGNPWYYVDDEKFMDMVIESEVDCEVSDWKYNYNDDDYDKKKLISYINTKLDDKPELEEIIRNKYIDKKNIKKTKSMDIDEILNELNNKKLKEIIEDELNKDEFCEDIVKERYKDYSAEDYIHDLYGKDDYTIFDNNYCGISFYMDTDAMLKQYKDNIEQNEMVERMAEKLKEKEDDDVVELQQMIYDKNPKENSVILIENDLANNDLATEYDFQKNYIEEVIKNEKFEDEMDKITFIWNKMKEYFIDQDFAINEDIAKEYDLLDLIDQEQSGYFNLKEKIKLDVKKGDTLLGGRYKNKQIIVKDIGKDENGQVTINGKPILKFRIWRNLPKNMKDKYKLKNKE